MGRDGPTGGTWLGVNIGTGEIAALTNYCSGKPFINMGSMDYSRGLLALNILEGKDEAPNLNHFLENGHNYNGVNLLYGDMKEQLSLATNYE